jgi:CRP/FNR family cyclic AMP-dependent transcriptional regulator
MRRRGTQNAKVEALRRAPLFEGLSKRELTELARVTDELAVPEGTVLCKEGALGSEFFVLLDGTADVTRNGKRLATRSAGEFVGEIALLTTSRRTATVTATTPLRCFVLTGRDFRRVLDENRSVERKVMQALAERVLSYAGDPAL